MFLGSIRKGTKSILTQAVILIVAVAFVVTLAYTGLPRSRGQGGEGAEAAALVGKQRITTGALELAVASTVRARLARESRVRPEAMPKLRSDILAELMDRAMFLQDARREGVRASEAEVKKQVKEIRDRFQSQEDYEAVLRNNGLTPQLLEQAIREDLTLSALQAHVTNVTVTDEDVANYYRRARVRHILIKSEGIDETLARKRAEEILARINKGEDFAAVAKEASQDPLTRSQGGEMMFTGSSEQTELSKAALALAPGQVSGIIKDSDGFHILKCEQKWEPKGKDFEDAKENLRSELLQQRRTKAWDTWVADLKKRTKLVVYDRQVLAYRAMQEGKSEESCELWRKELAEDADNVYVQVGLAMALKAKGDKEAALEAYRKAVEANPDDPYMHLMLGDVYRSYSMKEQALASYRKASELDTNDLVLHYNLSYTFMAMGSAKDAEAEAAKIKEIQDIRERIQKAQQEQQAKEEQKAREEQQKAKQEQQTGQR